MDTGKTVALIKALGGAGGAGGSGLPAVTSADKGKHLVVNSKIQPTSTVIIPEQTASFDAESGNYPLSNCVPSLFNDEGYVYAVVNGTVVSGTPSEGDIDSYSLGSPDGSILVVRMGDQMFAWLAFEEEPLASITVSVYVGEEAVEWGKEAIPTPAAVFDFRPGFNPSVVSGSYSATRAALEQFNENGGEMPLLLAYVVRGSGNLYVTTEFVGWQLQTGYIRLIMGSVYWHWNEDGSLEYED